MDIKPAHVAAARLFIPAASELGTSECPLARCPERTSVVGLDAHVWLYVSPSHDKWRVQLVGKALEIDGLPQKGFDLLALQVGGVCTEVLVTSQAPICGAVEVGAVIATAHHMALSESGFEFKVVRDRPTGIWFRVAVRKPRTVPGYQLAEVKF